MRLAAVLLTLALAGCGDPATTPRAETTMPTASSTYFTPTPAPTGTRTDLADGRHPAYLRSLDTAELTVVADVVQFLTGEAAEQAAKEDGAEVNNDYYVRNQNPLLRTLPVAVDATVVVNTLSAEETGSSTQDHDVTLAKLAGYFANGTAQHALFHLTLAAGVVTEIREQYLP